MSWSRIAYAARCGTMVRSLGAEPRYMPAVPGGADRLSAKFGAGGEAQGTLK
jgi:hypothetical protein